MSKACRNLSSAGGAFLLLVALVACGSIADQGPQTESAVASLQLSNDATTLHDGEFQLLNFTSSTAEVSLNDDTASYMFVVTSPARTKRSYSATLQNQNAKQMVTAGDDAEDFHQFMRDMEPVLARTEDEINPPSQDFKNSVLTPSIGSTREFKVLSTLGSISAYQTVTARLRRVSSVSYVYVDVTAESRSSKDLSDGDIEALASDFDDVAVPFERRVYGSESDVDGDGHMTLLMTPVLNQFQGTGGGIVTGFFFPGDVFAPSSSNPASNQMEIFYTLVPDNKGTYGVPMDHDFTLHNLLPGVLAHEYQHMISYNQHVLMRHAGSEEAWLNEGLSHLTEDLTGFGRENPSRVQLYLNAIGTTSVMPSGSPNLAERGGIYLLLRYLYEQSANPDQFLSRLLQTSSSGVTNLEAAFQGPSDFNEVGEFLQRWGIALAVSGLNISSDPRFNYQARANHPQTDYFTGICLHCDPQDGRQTQLNGPNMISVNSAPANFNVPAAGVMILKVANPPTNIQISGEADAALRGAIVRTPL